MTETQAAPRPSFVRSFRGAHVLLKLAFAVCLVLGGLLAADGVAYLYLRFYLHALDRPVYNQSLSGYRVFRNTPDYTMGTGILAKGPTDIMKTDKYGLVCDHEVTFEKPEGTFRVFLCGGSAMAGAGQTANLGYDLIKKYPFGTYAFDASIAGKVRDALQARLPGKKVEVINAAHNNKSFHQSFLQYVESLSRYSPDYVVEMDGFNDLNNISSGDPYSQWENEWLASYVGLWNESHRTETGSSYLKIAATLIAQKAQASRSKVKPRVGPFWTEEGLRKEYERVKPSMEKPTRRWQQVLRHYLATAKEDGCRIVFTIQPMVSRSVNKALSPTEKAFHELTVQPANEAVSPAYLFLRYYFDDWEPELKAEVERHGFTYADVRGAVTKLDASFELFVDYCHFTPEGNEFMGKTFADAILADLEKCGKK